VGDAIAILNPASRAVLEADVVAPGLVRVRPGSVPLTPAAASAARIAVR
jgi:hypothetical protein